MAPTKRTTSKVAKKPGAFFFLLAPGFLGTLLVVRFVGAIVDLVLLLWQWAIRASPKRATCGFLRVRSCLALLL